MAHGIENEPVFNDEPELLSDEQCANLIATSMDKIESRLEGFTISMLRLADSVENASKAFATIAQAFEKLGPIIDLLQDAIEKEQQKHG